MCSNNCNQGRTCICEPKAVPEVPEGEFVVCDTCGRETDIATLVGGLCPVCARHYHMLGG